MHLIESATPVLYVLQFTFTALKLLVVAILMVLTNTAPVVSFQQDLSNKHRRVARIWKRGGGAFLKEWEKCKRPWPEFSLFLNQFHTVCPKIETEFLGKLGNSNVFPPKNRWSSKKKVFTETEFDFAAKIGNSNVFSALKQVVSKKKKEKVFTEIEFDFSAKIGVKSTKNVRFCILHKPAGGSFEWLWMVLNRAGVPKVGSNMKF